jgi:competence protein ComEC
VLLLPAVLLFAIDRPPDVLVADTTQAVAYRADAGLQLVTGKPDTFAVDAWRESYGEAIEAAHPGSVQCDTVGCIARSPQGFTLAVIRDPAGFYEDCAFVDLVVTRLVAPSNCRASTVIDAEDLARGGVHWLRWDAAREVFDVRPAITGLSQPWRVAPP